MKATIVETLAELANHTIEHDSNDGWFLTKLTPEQAYVKGIEDGKVLLARTLTQTFFPLSEAEINAMLIRTESPT